MAVTERRRRYRIGFYSMNVCGQLIALIGLTAALFREVSAQSEFQVLLSRFRNDEGLAADGHCCESMVSSSPASASSSSTGRCSEPCRTFFRICLSHYQTIIPDMPTCTYGELPTNVIGGNSFDIPITTGFSFSSPPTSSAGVTRSKNNVSSSEMGFDNPIRFPLRFSWPGYFTIIIEAYHSLSRQGPSRGSPRQLIWHHAKQHKLDSGPVWQNVTSPSSIADTEATTPRSTSSLTFSYRVLCTSGYYGSKCDTICMDRDDKFGHYTCDQDGNRVCHLGWSGSFCNIPVCLPGCNNRTGRCDEPNECKCSNGWQGPRCDECVPLPGCHRGTCQQPWECNCLPGWQGLYCNLDPNFCTTNRPCRNGATCRNVGEGSYECLCLPGYAGTNCQLEASDCSKPESPCFNGGSCVAVTAAESVTLANNRSTVTAHCRCAPGWRGTRCESRVTDTCDDRPCRNGGACVAMTTGVNGDGSATHYRCSCPAGFTGINCEQEIDECASQPCRNGGRCIDDVNRFRCVCPAGYTGFVCQTNPDDCATKPCLNNAECIDEINGFRCRCRTGYGGTLCQDDVDECASSPCPTGSTCQNLVAGFRCICPNNFTDPLCSARAQSTSSSPMSVAGTDPCRSSPCLNRALCIVERRRLNDGTPTSADDEYECRCPSGFFGRRCETAVDSSGSRGDAFVPTTNKSPDDEMSMSVTGLLVPPPVGESTENMASSMDTLIELLLIAGLGVLVPSLAIGLTVAIVVVVRRRRRRTKRRSTAAAFFIENATTSNGSNNRLSLRDNQLNTAAASTAASVRYSLKLMDDSELVCGGVDDKSGGTGRALRGKSMGASFVDVRFASDGLSVHGGGAASASCSFVKLTNHQQQQQRELQQQQLMLSQHRQQQQQQQQKQHNSNIYRPPSYGVRRSVYGDPSSNLLTSVCSTSSSSRSVIVPFKTTNVEPRRCYGDTETGADDVDDDIKSAAVMLL